MVAGVQQVLRRLRWLDEFFFFFGRSVSGVFPSGERYTTLISGMDLERSEKETACIDLRISGVWFYLDTEGKPKRWKPKRFGIQPRGLGQKKTGLHKKTVQLVHVHHGGKGGMGPLQGIFLQPPGFALVNLEITISTLIFHVPCAACEIRDRFGSSLMVVVDC